LSRGFDAANYSAAALGSYGVEPTTSPAKLSSAGHQRLRGALNNLDVLVKARGDARWSSIRKMHTPRGIADKSMVEVRSRTGAVCVTAEISEDIRRGVVSLPHG
jgi:hypothetical protein